MPAPTVTPSPAEQAIADSRAAYEDFLRQANDEVFTPRVTTNNATALNNPPTAPSSSTTVEQIALNTIGEAMTRQAANQLASVAREAADQRALLPPGQQQAQQPAATPTRGPDGRFLPREQGAQATQQPAQSGVPNPPPSAIPGAPTPQPPAQPGNQPTQQPTAPPDAFADVLPPDAIDRGAKLNSSNWKRLHAKADTIAAERDQWRQRYEQEIAQVRASTGQPSPDVLKQVEALSAERDQLLARLEAAAVERSPRFEQMFKPRQDAAIRQAKEAVGPVRASQVAEILAMPQSTYRDQQIDAILPELNPLQQHKLTAAVASIDSLAAERQELSSQGQQLYKQWQQEEQQVAQRQQQERAQRVTAEFDAVTNEWKTAGLSSDDLQLARNVFMGQTTIRDMANTAMWAVYGPKAAAQAMKLQQELTALQQEVSRYRGAQPGTANDAGSSSLVEDAPTVGGLEGLIQTIVKSGAMAR